MLVIGSGPGGQKAAIAAAKLGRRVAVIDRPDMVGGVSIHTGTIPSKTLREAVIYLSGLSQRDLYGQSYRLKENITVADLTARTRHVVGREVDVIRAGDLRGLGPAPRGEIGEAGAHRFVQGRTKACHRRSP